MGKPSATLGPDARRYLAAGYGQPVPRPFHLRWLLPVVLGDDIAAWAFVRRASWAMLAGAMFAWALAADLEPGLAVAATLLLVALPGIAGPNVVNPIGVDLPATALTLAGVVLVQLGHPAQIVAGVALVGIAAAIKETSPVWAALWVWSPWPLVALVVPVVAALVRKPGPDPLGPKFQEIADHPIRSAWQHHAPVWRNAWVMVAPWGVCLAALVGMDCQLGVVLAVAYGQLLVATDSVRLYQHGAGPAMALAAVQVIPPSWLPLAVAAHVVWWWKPERV